VVFLRILFAILGMQNDRKDQRGERI